MPSAVRTVLLAFLAFAGACLLHVGWLFLPRPAGVIYTVVGAALCLLTILWLRMLWLQFKSPPNHNPFTTDVEE